MDDKHRAILKEQAQEKSPQRYFATKCLELLQDIDDLIEIKSTYETALGKLDGDKIKLQAENNLLTERIAFLNSQVSELLTQRDMQFKENIRLQKVEKISKKILKKRNYGFITVPEELLTKLEEALKDKTID